MHHFELGAWDTRQTDRRIAGGVLAVDSWLAAVSLSCKSSANSRPVPRHVAGQFQPRAAAAQHLSADHSRSRAAAWPHTDRHAAAHQPLHSAAARHSRRHSAPAARRLPRLARHAVARRRSAPARLVPGPASYVPRPRPPTSGFESPRDRDQEPTTTPLTHADEPISVSQQLQCSAAALGGR